MNYELFEEDDLGEDVDTGFNGIDAKLMPPRSSMSIINLTEQMADHYLGINRYENQRVRKERRQEELKRKAKDGRFHGGEIAVAKLSFPYSYKDDNGETKSVLELLMNGQHQCHLVKELGKPQLTTLKEFTVDKPEQLPVLFSQFDQPGGIRSPGQIAQAYSASLPCWQQRAITTCAGAVGWIAQGRFDGGIAVATKHNMTVDERIEKMLTDEFLPHAEWAYKLVWSDNGQHEYAHMTRQPVLASMIRSHKLNSDKAQEFWYAVKTGINLAVNSPQLALRNWLTTVSIGNTSGESGEKKKKKVSSLEVSSGCDKAFESFLNGQTFTKLYLSRRPKRKSRKSLEVTGSH